MCRLLYYLDVRSAFTNYRVSFHFHGSSHEKTQFVKRRGSPKPTEVRVRREQTPKTTVLVQNREAPPSRSITPKNSSVQSDERVTVRRSPRQTKTKSSPRRSPQDRNGQGETTNIANVMVSVLDSRHPQDATTAPEAVKTIVLLSQLPNPTLAMY